MSVEPIPNSYWGIPGTFAAGEYPGAKSGAAARAKLSELLLAGIRVFVDLTEEGELLPYADLLQRESARIGVRTEWHRMPIPDVSIPSLSDMTRIQRTIARAIQQERPVYVHC